jgi:hypothetical protein
MIDQFASGGFWPGRSGLFRAFVSFWLVLGAPSVTWGAVVCFVLVVFFPRLFGLLAIRGLAFQIPIWCDEWCFQPLALGFWYWWLAKAANSCPLLGCLRLCPLGARNEGEGFRSTHDVELLCFSLSWWLQLWNGASIDIKAVVVYTVVPGQISKPMYWVCHTYLLSIIYRSLLPGCHIVIIYNFFVLWSLHGFSMNHFVAVIP